MIRAYFKEGRDWGNNNSKKKLHWRKEGKKKPDPTIGRVSEGEEKNLIIYLFIL